MLNRLGHRLIKAHPYSCSSQLDACDVVVVAFVILGGNGRKVPEFVEEALDQIAPAIEPPVEAMRLEPVGHGLDVGPCSARGERFVQGVGGVGGVGQQHFLIEGGDVRASDDGAASTRSSRPMVKRTSTMLSWRAALGLAGIALVPLEVAQQQTLPGRQGAGRRLGREPASAAGLVTRHVLCDGKARYERARSGPHHHLIDIDTGQVVEVDDAKLTRLVEGAARQLGYRLVDYRLRRFGERT
jgi:hypothetical protein